MEIGEACALAEVSQEEAKCNPPGTDTSNWRAKIDGINGCEGDAAVLKNNMGDAPD